MAPNKHYDAIIIGGGIAGASVAYSLSRRKIKTLLLERREDLALEASGNPTGLIYPFLTKHQSIEGKFSLASFYYITEELSRIESSSDHLKRPSPASSVFLLPKDEIEKERYLGAISAYSIPGNILAYDHDEFSKRDGFHFKTAIAISPRQLTITFAKLADPFLEIKYYENFQSINRDNDIKIITEKDEFRSEYLFLCHANSFLEHSETQWIPIRKVRGQLLWLPQCEELKDLPHSYLFGDYLTKDIGHGSVLGASFDEFKLEDTKRDMESISFLENASVALPRLGALFQQMKSSDLSNLKTRVSFRSQSQDRRPIFGPLPNYASFKENYPSLPSPSTGKLPNIPSLRNTFVLGALGSRGLTHALFASEIIVRDALQIENLLTESDYQDFKPARFLLRNWKRGNK